MKLTFLGGAGMVTGSSYLIETEHCSFMLDYGMYQGGKDEEALNEEEARFAPNELDFVILSHAHIDHSGRLPLLVKQGFKGPIHATKPTADLCEIMLLDSAKIQEQDVEWENKTRKRSGKPQIEPLYTTEDAERSLRYFEPQFYDSVIQVHDTVRIRFQDAGHILGSAIVEIWITEAEGTTKIVFSGDLGMPNKPIIRDPSFIEEADYLIMESTYGNTTHEPQEQAFERLMEIITETAHKNGTVIIPAFSVGRTQELIYQMNAWYENANLSEAERIPIYLDSPMAIRATEAFRQNSMVFDEEAQTLLRSGDNPFVLENLHFTKDVEESKMLNKTNFPRVIISASGMATGGRVRHHLKHHLWQDNSAVVFVGYQAEGTLGRLLTDGIKEVKLFGEEIAVKAHIENVDGFSGHADRPMLLSWLSHFTRKPKKIFLVHGEAEEMMPLAEELRSQGHKDVFTPARFDSFELTVPEDAVEKVPDPERMKQELEAQYAQVLEDIEGIARIREVIGKELSPVEYQSMRRKLMQIQSDVLDMKMLISK